MQIPPSILRSFSELSHLSDTDLQQMAKQLRRLQYREGTHICREGDDGDSCYLLVEGTVQITKDLPDGRSVHLASLSPKVIIGQTGLVSGQKRTAQVRATTDVELLSLHREPYLWALQRGSPWAVSFLQMVGVNLVRQIRTAMERLDVLASAEDVDAEITGEVRKVTTKKEYINMTGFQSDASVVPPSSSAVTPPSASTPAPAVGPSVDQVNPELSKTDNELLSLLQSTEQSLGNVNVDLDDIEFVNEDDMRK